MVSLCPIAFVISYRQILDFCLYDFFKDVESLFVKDPESNLYICSKKISKNRLITYFRQKIEEYLKNEQEKIQHDEKYLKQKFKKLFVIDGCSDICNHFLFDDEVKLFKHRFSCIESDIVLDFDLLEEIWRWLFIRYFKKGGFLDWKFVRANDITTNELYEIVKLVFGNKHCKMVYDNFKPKILIDSTENQFKKKTDDKLSKFKIQEITEYIKNAGI